MTPLEPPDSHHLMAAKGWLELDNYLAANEELEKIAPGLKAHPLVLFTRCDIYVKAKKWDYALPPAAHQACHPAEPDGGASTTATVPSVFRLRTGHRISGIPVDTKSLQPVFDRPDEDMRAIAGDARLQSETGWIHNHPGPAVMHPQRSHSFIPKSAFSLFFLRRKRLFQAAQSSGVSSGAFGWFSLLGCGLILWGGILNPIP